MDISGSFGRMGNGKWIRDLQSIERDSERGSTKRLGIQPQSGKSLKLTTPKNVVTFLCTFTITVQTPQGNPQKEAKKKREREKGN